MLRNSNPHDLCDPTALPRLARNETYAKDIIQAWKADINAASNTSSRHNSDTLGTPFPYRNEEGNEDLAGYLVIPSSVDVNSDSPSKKVPVVILFHTGAGPQDIFIRYIADTLAREKIWGSTGCIILIADIVSDGIGWTWGDRPRYRSKRDDLNEVVERDGHKLRWKMRDAVSAALNAAKSIDVADKNRIAAWGFCLGGQPVLELGRMQCAGVKGLITFHGMFDGVSVPSDIPMIDDTERRVLVCNGKKDKYVTESDLDLAKATFEAYGWDFRLLNFDNVTHNFSNPRTEYDDDGFGYDDGASKESWAAALELIEDVFGL